MSMNTRLDTRRCSLCESSTYRLWQVDVGTRVRDQPHHVRLALSSCDEQRSGSLEVFARVNAEATPAQQYFHALEVPTLRSRHQRSDPILEARAKTPQRQ